MNIFNDDNHARSGKLQYDLEAQTMSGSGTLVISPVIWSAIWKMEAAKVYRHEEGADCTLLFTAFSTSEGKQVAVYIDDNFYIYTCPMDEFEQEFSEIKNEKTN